MDCRSAMAEVKLLMVWILFCFLVDISCGQVFFSTLPETLLLTASPLPGQVLKAGRDKMTVTWGPNQNPPTGEDATYKTVKVKLCYAPPSQVDRGWRKTVDNLEKDKTCQFTVVARPYNLANKTVQSFEWTVEKDVPTGTYFVRAYAVNSADIQVAFGQTTDAQKKTNLFSVEGISGRHVSLDFAAGCFSAFSILSLVGFFIAEKRRSKSSK